MRCLLLPYRVGLIYFNPMSNIAEGVLNMRRTAVKSGINVKRGRSRPSCDPYFGDADLNATAVSPGGQTVAECFPEGVVTLRGDYLWKHEKEIRRILHNEVERVMAQNPLAKVVRMINEDDALIIETTEQKLAEQLGCTLNRAHRGELLVEWSGSPKICRVSWERWN